MRRALAGMDFDARFVDEFHEENKKPIAWIGLLFGRGFLSRNHADVCLCSGPEAELDFSVTFAKRVWSSDPTLSPGEHGYALANDDAARATSCRQSA